ncbi:MAG: cupin domain-containing protein [Nanoarchaeota archaeon]
MHTGKKPQQKTAGKPKSLGDLLNVRLIDNSAANGKLIEVFRGEKEIERYLGQLRQVTAHVFTQGRVGGNHFHKEKYEMFYVSGGRVLVFLKDLQSGEILTQEVYPGRKFNFLPGYAHAIHNPHQKTAHLIEFTNLPFNPNNKTKDSYVHKIIDTETGKIV